MTGPAMTPLDRVDQMTRVAAALAKGEAPAPADGAAFAAGWAIYVRDAALGVTLEDALGMSPSDRGQEHWTTTRSRRRRDDAIRALGTQPLFANLKITEAAREIAALGCRYRHAGRATKQAAPLAIDRETEELLTEALCTGQRFPGQKRIQSILEIK
jgi:hypothetical protein